MNPLFKYLIATLLLGLLYVFLFYGLTEKLYTKAASGTGFFISDDGYIVTNEHVVHDYKEVYIMYKGLMVPAVVIAQDALNDVAILKVETQMQSYYKLQDPFKDKTNVGVFGYPRPGTFGTDLKYSEGTASHALIGDWIDLTAKICPGNSGSPVISESGNVIGIAEFVWIAYTTDRWGCSDHAGAVYIKYAIKLAKKFDVPIDEGIDLEAKYKLATLFTDAKDKNKSVLVWVKL